MRKSLPPSVSQKYGRLFLPFIHACGKELVHLII